MNLPLQNRQLRADGPEALRSHICLVGDVFRLQLVVLIHRLLELHVVLLSNYCDQIRYSN